MKKTLIEHSDMTPPTIAPVPAGVDRPLWSVMIPTYNCANYLRQTLESVLSQDPGPEQMQIEVIDDCSTQDDPEAVVQEVGKGRVSFYRKPKNEGAIANFNTCIERSRGELVHILHGDDWISSGFYKKIESLNSLFPEAAIFATRVFFCDENNIFTGLSPRIESHESFISKDISPFIQDNPLQFAGITVRRSSYENHGGFLSQLVHTADWEMWLRVIAKGGAIVSPEVLAGYRIFASNDTGRLKKTAENLIDRERLACLLSSKYKVSGKKIIKKNIEMSLQQANIFRMIGDYESANNNLIYWKRRATKKDKILRTLRTFKTWLD